MTDEVEIKKAFDAISEAVMGLIETETDAYAIILALLAILRQLARQADCTDLVADALEALKDVKN
jgi:hypothetical protein